MSKTLRFCRNFLLNDEVTLTPSTADSEFPVSNLKDQLRSKVWRTTAVTDQSVIIDLQTSEEIDSIAVFFRANQPIRLTQGATIRIEGNASLDFTSPLFSQVITLDTENLSISHFLTTPENHRYWRLFIDDPGNPYGHIEIPIIVLGKSIQFDGVGIGFKWGLIDPSKSRRTRFGQKYSDVYPTRRTCSMEVPIETLANFESLVDFYESVGTTEAILFSLDPEELIFDKDRFLIWGTFEDNFDATHSAGNFFTMPFKVEEIL